MIATALPFFMPTDRTWDFSVAILVVLAITVLGSLIPAIFIAKESPKEDSFTQTEGNELVFSANYIAIATNIDNSGQRPINVTVINEKTGNSNNTGILDEGDTTTITVDNNQINISNKDVIDQSTAIISYERPIYIGWPKGAKFIIDNISGIIIILLVVIIVATFSVLYGGI